MRAQHWQTFMVGGGIGLLLSFMLPSIYAIQFWIIFGILAMVYESKFTIKKVKVK